MEQGRKVPLEVCAVNSSVKLSAKVASNHSKIPRLDSPAVAQDVRELFEVDHG